MSENVYSQIKNQMIETTTLQWNHATLLDIRAHKINYRSLKKHGKRKIEDSSRY